MAAIMEHHMYFIRDDYYDTFQDTEFFHTKSSNKKTDRRTYYYAIKFNHIGDMYYFIPVTSNVEKWERISEKADKKGRPTDFVHITKIGKKKQAFIIGKMIPVPAEYVAAPYKMNGQPYKVVSKSDIRSINLKIRTILEVTKSDTPIRYQTNIKQLLNQIDRKTSSGNKQTVSSLGIPKRIKKKRLATCLKIIFTFVFVN